MVRILWLLLVLAPFNTFAQEKVEGGTGTTQASSPAKEAVEASSLISLIAGGKYSSSNVADLSLDLQLDVQGRGTLGVWPKGYSRSSERCRGEYSVKTTEQPDGRRVLVESSEKPAMADCKQAWMLEVLEDGKKLRSARGFEFTR